MSWDISGLLWHRELVLTGASGLRGLKRDGRGGKKEGKSRSRSRGWNRLEREGQVQHSIWLGHDIMAAWCTHSSNHGVPTPVRSEFIWASGKL